MSGSDWKAERLARCKPFLDGWDWERVFRAWKRRIANFRVPIKPIFDTVSIHDPANPTGRSRALSWWPAGEIQTLQKDLQKYFDQHPGTVGNVHPPAYYTRQGEIETLEYIWDQKEDEEGIAAILIAASIFARCSSARSHYPRDYWPDFACVRIIEEWAEETWRSRAQHVGMALLMHASSTES